MMTRPWRVALFVVACAVLILLLSNGTRMGFALFLKPMTATFGWSRESFGFAIALQNIVWGLSQPFVGALADRWGPRKVIVSAALVYALGLYAMAHAQTPIDLSLSAGVLVGLALSGTSFPVVLAVVGRSAPPERRTFLLSIAATGGSAGQLAVIPATQSLIAGFGIVEALFALSALALLMVPLGMALGGGIAHRVTVEPPSQSVREALTKASRHQGFWLLTSGFFVCGFHIAFVATHLPAYVVDHGLNAGLGASALAVLGLGNLFGTIGSGYLGGRYRVKYVLSALYLLRSVLIGLFLSVPVTDLSVLVFAFALGLVWLGTVPLTNSLVGQIFGLGNVGMLFGIVFVSHQIGSFFGAWYGGYSFDAHGSYAPAWGISIALGVVAAVLHYPIDDRAVPQLAGVKAR